MFNARLQERKFCTKTAALNVRLPRLWRKISPRFILAGKPQCWMSDFRLSGERARNVARGTAAATACPISQVSKDARLRHRSFHLWHWKAWEEVLSKLTTLHYCNYSIALAAFLPWAVESIPSKVSASRACKASSGSHRGFRCFLGSRIQYYMIQNTVQYLLGRRMQYSMIQNTAPQLLGSVRPTGSHHTPLTLSPEGLPHPNPMHNLGKIPILFRKVLMKYVFLILCYVFPKVVANKLKLHTFQTLWGNHLVAAERHKGNMPEGRLEESKKYTGNTNTNTNTNKKYTGNTKEGFTGNVTCHVLQPAAAYPLQPF